MHSKLWGIVMAIVVGISLGSVVIGGLVFTVSGIKCIIALVDGVKPTTIQYFGLGFLSLCAMLMSASWYYIETNE